MRKSLRSGLAVASIATVVAGLGTSAALASSPGAAPKPHIVGTWANDVDISQAGGYTVWSNGRVQAHDGAPSFGGASSKHVNDIVGFVPDLFANGYWLIGRNGAIYGIGTTCPFGHLKGPANAPSSGIVGGIDLKKFDEGLVLVSKSGKTYQFRCTVG